MPYHNPIPLIDIFAGPGGLGEGFASLRIGQRRVFHSALSIEKDPAAHRTLKLRAFTRQFPDGQIHEDYYRYLRNQITLDQLYTNHPDQEKAASREAWCHTLAAETNGKVRNRILQNLSEPETPWVLLGGPPCQPFSLAGRSRNAPGSNTQHSDGKEKRHTLYREYLQIIADFWPAVFVMENVKGLLSAKFDGQTIFPQIKRDLQDPAAVVGNKRRRVPAHTYTLHTINPPPEFTDNASLYETETLPQDFLVRCEDYGIPQARHRLILLGVRDDLAAPGKHPFPITPGHLTPQSPVPARRVFDGLPTLRGGLTPQRDDSPAAWEGCLLASADSDWLAFLRHHDPAVHAAVHDTLNQLHFPTHGRGGDYLPGAEPPGYRPDWYQDEELPGVCNHQARGHMPSDLHRYLFAAAFAQTHGRSPKLADFPPALLPAHQNAQNPGTHTKFADRFRVQLPHKPATTVVSHIAKDGHYYIHPDPTQCRSLTVREAARLQTFPDNYRFVGNRTEQYHQVGNAVPPLIAHQIAGIVYDVLKQSGHA